MRIASLLPSATEIVCLLGLRDELVGITHECDHPPGIEKQKRVMVESCLGPDGKRLPPGEIDRRIVETYRAGEGIYRLVPGAMEELAPDVIVTQGLCDVCALPNEHVHAQVKALGLKARVIDLNPTCLADILENIREVGEATGRDDEAHRAAQALQARMAAVAARTHALQDGDRPRVACIEWTDPIFYGGHWVPEMVRLAGGRDVLGIEGAPSKRVDWPQVVDAAPEVIVVMPCGYDLARTVEEMDLLRNRPGWSDLPAVKSGRVYAVHANNYFSRPGPRTFDGLEQLAQMLHPELFPAPASVSLMNWKRVQV